MFKILFRKFLDFAFPARCLLCGGVLAGEDGICAGCLNLIDFVSEPKCRHCGRPFEFESDEDGPMACPSCLMLKPKFDRCVSAVMYNEASKKIILPFKHADATHLAKFMAGIMAARGAELLDPADIIIPVPIHRLRMLKRKYNQAALLARFIGKKCKKPVLFNVFTRRRATKSQGHMSLKDRKANVRGAFFAKPDPRLKGARVLLVDDVFTTGATANECARVLKAAGAARVYVLTFARA
jgi:ComF family protein